MLRILFVNTCILISMAFIANVFFGKRIHCNNKCKLLKLQIGLLSGLNSVILLFFPITLSNVAFCLGFLPIMTSAFYGGPFSVIISSFILLTAKILFPNLCTLGMPEYISLFAICSLCGCMLKTLKQSLKFWTSMIAIICTVQNIYSLIEYNNFYNIITTILPFDAINIFAGILAYSMFVYMRSYNIYVCKLEKDCEKDYLTDIYNVRTFENKLTQLSQDKQTKDISLLLLDIDHFKIINDTYGHTTGDIVLKDFANILKNNCREFDNICRIGGEEFAIILRKCSRERASLVSQRIKDEVSNHKFFTDKNEPINVTVSIGISHYPETNIFDLKKKADNMLYKAKNSGRNKICS